MDDLLFGSGLLISFSVGMAAISFAYGLQKRYRTSALASYLYFQVFVTVFGVYGLIGQVIARKILEQRSAAFQTTEAIGHFFGFLGFPFLILAGFMFLRLCWEITGEGLPRRIMFVYFLLLVILFLVYGTVILLANLSPFSDLQYAALSRARTYAYVAMGAIVIAVGLGRLFGRRKETKTSAERKGIRLFGWTWLFSYSAGLIIFLFARRLDLPPVVSIIAFFAANLLPLLRWRAHLSKYPVVPAPPLVAPADLSRFLVDFKISRREEEVIRELCAGKSNKEISQSLFISVQTVKDHIYRVYQKTDVRNRVQLINLIQSYKKGEREL